MTTSALYFSPCHLIPHANQFSQLVKAAETVNQHGAKEVYAIVTHGILSGKAIENINASCLAGLVVTNSALRVESKDLLNIMLTITLAVPLGDKTERCPKLKVIDVSATLAEVGALNRDFPLESSTLTIPLLGNPPHAQR